MYAVIAPSVCSANVKKSSKSPFVYSSTYALLFLNLENSSFSMATSVNVSTDCSILEIKALISLPVLSQVKTSSFSAAAFDNSLVSEILRRLIKEAVIREHITIATVIFIRIDFMVVPPHFIHENIIAHISS